MNSDNSPSGSHLKLLYLVIGASAIVIVVLSLLVWWLMSNKVKQSDTQAQSTPSPSGYEVSPTASPTATPTSFVMWGFDQQTRAWTALSTPPACPNPIGLTSPVDTTQVTSVLYPGQVRGGDYKAHGGFRFDNNTNNAVRVTMPIDGYVVRASQYLESGEIQYLFDIINPCGLMVRFDHLFTLSPAFAAIAQQLPTARVDDSRTTVLNPPVKVDKGDLVATAVGHVKTNNVAVDFGFYDLRQRNSASLNATWANGTQQKHKAEQTYFAVCWLHLLPQSDQSRLNALAGLGEGKQSDYCK